MKNPFFGLLLRLLPLVFLFVSCKNDSVTTGASVLDRHDSILVFADTFRLGSALYDCSSIISSPDSFLLGEMESSYGLVRAEILTQLACPVGFTYPEGSEVDSVCLYLYYGEWDGDGETPLQIDVHEMDRTALSYATSYHSDIDLADYCSLHDSTAILREPRIVLAAHPTDSVSDSSTGTTSGVIALRTTDAFTQRFFHTRDFTTQDAFNRDFQGLYIHSAFGGSTVLHITDIAMMVFYHFTYDNQGETVTVSDMKGFFANSEVRQVNRIDYADKQTMRRELESHPDNNYIIAPAGIYTRISIPLKQMEDTISQRIADKRPYVNKAGVRTRITNVYTGSANDVTRDDWQQPAERMLLLREDMEHTFFDKRMLPSDTVAILSSLAQSTDSAGNTVYSYNFDISMLLTYRLRQHDLEPAAQNRPDTLHMLMIPVDIETTTNSSTGVSSVIGIQQSQTLSTTIIRSAQYEPEPMTLEVVYSGF